MYNRYIRGEGGAYAPVSHGEPERRGEERRHGEPHRPGSRPGGPQGASPLSGLQNLLNFGGRGESEESFLRRLLARFHLEDVDTGDLILLLLLFFLLEEKADDELLIALGLLLIL